MDVEKRRDILQLVHFSSQWLKSKWGEPEESEIKIQLLIKWQTANAVAKDVLRGKTRYCKLYYTVVCRYLCIPQTQLSSMCVKRLTGLRRERPTHKTQNLTVTARYVSTAYLHLLPCHKGPEISIFFTKNQLFHEKIYSF